MRPLIGITTGATKVHERTYNKATNYYDHALEQAGALPVLLPILTAPKLAAEIASRLDGILISGGNDDIDPACYGESPCQGVCQISPERDSWEFELYRNFKSMGKPVLGICRGCQLINVFEGGSLYQNLCDQVKDSSNHFTHDKKMCELYHNIKIEADSQLFDMFETENLSINSFHNQAVKTIAPGFRASAYSEDGIIEAIESESAESFIVGIQAHPEALTERYPHFIRLFNAFVTAAKETMP